MGCTAGKYELTKCLSTRHILKGAPCAKENCNLNPIVCATKTCGYESVSLKDKKGKPAIICKLCHTTETMDDLADDLPEDYEPPKMELVYSINRKVKSL